jgi:uncharacterized membrane protein YfcA
MSALALLTLFAVGLLVGFVAGLIGIGGGVLIVPFLYFFYQHAELVGFALPDTLQVAVAHATSLFVILPTAARGSWSYSKAGLVEWRVALTVALAAIIGGVAGARLAILLPGEVLKLVFGVLLVASGAQLVSRRGTAGERPVSTNVIATSATGLLVGLLSGMMGVGGGILALPLLIYLLHVELRRAAATSLAIVGFAAIGGLITYAVSGAGVVGRAPFSLGYIHYAAGIPILLGSLLSVHWGTVVNQRLHTRVLRYIFAAVFIALGLRFILQNAGVVFG